jgi:carbonic anhydrase
MVRQWLQHAETTRRIMEENYPELSPAEKYEVAIQEHVLVQLENLQTHPSVAVKLQRNQIALHGWIYQLETGQVHAFSPRSGIFEPLMGDKPMESAALAGPVTSNVLPSGGTTPSTAGDNAPPA